MDALGLPHHISHMRGRDPHLDFIDPRRKVSQNLLEIFHDRLLVDSNVSMGVQVALI